MIDLGSGIWAMDYRRYHLKYCIITIGYTVAVGVYLFGVGNVAVGLQIISVHLVSLQVSFPTHLISRARHRHHGVRRYRHAGHDDEEKVKSWPPRK